MNKPRQFEAKSTLQIFQKDTLIKGRPAQLDCVNIGGQCYVVSRGVVSMIGLEDEWYEDVNDPLGVIETLKSDRGLMPDIFTFWQRAPDFEPRYSFPVEWEEIALLPVKSYDHWWNHQIKSRTRNQIRKAEKDGVVVRECAYDDEFVCGMTAIFNESPVRQGRKFWHYGKDVDTVKRQFSKFIDREIMIGAFYQEEMIGFVMLGNAGRFGLTGQVLSAIKHRDKSTNNILIAKAVEICAQRGLPYLCYIFWSGGSLTEFKRRCGFEPRRIPRYFVPLTARGRLALKLGVHRGWKELVPPRIKDSLKSLRSRWYEYRNS